MNKLLLIIISSCIIFSCSEEKGKKSLKEQVEAAKEKRLTQKDTLIIHHNANYSYTPPTIDGSPDDSIWTQATSYPINHIWLGDKNMTNQDFNGSFKLAWNEDHLFLLVEVTDDTLIDIYEEQFSHWWDDDCVEIFIDENKSKGDHQFNHNAFAYHVGVNYDVVDLGPDSLPHLYNEHVQCQRSKTDSTFIWECAIKIFDDSYVDNGENTPIKLHQDKVMGFMLAYCDNDTSKTRENFIGSIEIEGIQKEDGTIDYDRGWIDAGVFGNVRLIKN